MQKSIGKIIRKFHVQSVRWTDHTREFAEENINMPAEGNTYMPTDTELVIPDCGACGEPSDVKIGSGFLCENCFADLKKISNVLKPVHCRSPKCYRVLLLLVIKYGSKIYIDHCAHADCHKIKASLNPPLRCPKCTMHFCSEHFLFADEDIICDNCDQNVLY